MVIGNSIPCIIRIIDIFDRLINLNKQEQLLGFSFNEEMKENNVTSTKFESSDWYIDIRNFFHPFKRVVFIVLKKEFIQSLGKKERIVPNFPSFSHLEPPFSPTYSGIREMMIVVMIDGTKQKIITYDRNKVIDIFEAWYRRVDHKARLPSKRKSSRKERNNRKR